MGRIVSQIMGIEFEFYGIKRFWLLNVNVANSSELYILKW